MSAALDVAQTVASIYCRRSFYHSRIWITFAILQSPRFHTQQIAEQTPALKIHPCVHELRPGKAGAASPFLGSSR